MTGTSVPPQPEDIALRITDIWRDLFGDPQMQIEPQDNFFLLGAPSLLALSLAERLRAEFGVPVSVLSVAEKPTVAQLTEHVLAHSAAGPLDEGEI
ncbi:MAG TPA: acyl carrier protein [Actinocrinis sp.]|uniref:acyl carrier protein n=1 Tax=Actinocrinis sp. TaxID=1920516 RepID=UPI002DDD1478|nr:acyl carrier protein [Actinocrinis sp.]HEV2345417.1 acyl carrier protein [Actinocrinis sp.]